MALGGNDAQSTQGLDLLVHHFPLFTQFVDARLTDGLRQALIAFNGLHVFFNVAAQHNVGATTRHVGGNRDHAGTTGLGHDVRFAGVLLGVEHLVRQLVLGQQLCNQLGVFNRGGAHQHRLAPFVAFPDVGNRRVVTLLRCFVDTVQLVFTLALAVGRDHHRLQTVNFLELIRLSVGRTRHAANLVVQAEIVLERDGRHRLVFGLDLHALFGFNGLMQSVAPTATGHQPSRELVHDHDLTLLHHIVLVSVVQMTRTQSSIQMVHQRDVGRVIQAGAFRDQAHLRQHSLGFFVTVFGQEHLMRLLVDREVTGRDDALPRSRVGFALLPGEQRHHLVHGHVSGGVVLGLSTDDQGRAGLIDQNRIHLVDDGEVQGALNTVMGLIDHVVAQIIKTVFVVGAVSDVGVVGRLLFFAWQLRQVDAHRQSQEVVELAHPLGISAGQVIVHRDHVHTFASDRIEVGR